QGQAVLSRQQPVEHDEVVVLAGKMQVALFGRVGQVDDEPLLAQSARQQARRLAVVLDDEQSHTAVVPAPGRKVGVILVPPRRSGRILKKYSGTLGPIFRI